MLAFLFQGNLELLLVLAPPLLLSLTLHEFAHARVALMFGDPTALRAGRVSLNPLRHLDPLGTICLFFVGFGWAKPVPVNPFLLRPPRLGDFLVSFAGPLTNLALAILAGLSLRILIASERMAHFHTPNLLFEVLLYCTIINLALFTFNLIPLYPLDGHHMVREALPTRMREGFMRWQFRYGRIAFLVIWIGPSLMEHLTPGRAIPNPAGWLMDGVMTVGLRILGIHA